MRLTDRWRSYLSVATTWTLIMERQQRQQQREEEGKKILIRNIIICFVDYILHSYMCSRPKEKQKVLSLYCWLAAGGHQRTSDSKSKAKNKTKCSRWKCLQTQWHESCNEWMKCNAQNSVVRRSHPRVSLDRRRTSDVSLFVVVFVVTNCFR